MKKIDKKELHEIFQNLRNKDQSAYNTLYEKYYKLVYGIVFSIIKNKADSEDITHEIFTKIYRLDSSKLPLDHEASWLFTVSKNECLLFLRKSKPNISIEEIYEMPENTNGIDGVVERDYFNRLINGLKEDEKIIVSLKVLSDFTFKKISQVMNIPIGTVQWKYYNAINSLKISIGSLVGAAFAFIIVIARGEFWKNKEYLKKDEKKEITNNAVENSAQKTEDNITVNENSSVNNEGTEKQLDDKNETNTSTEITYNEGYNQSKSNKLDGIQISFIIVGITFFVIFVIFFKKYQQKSKIKSSK